MACVDWSTVWCGTCFARMQLRIIGTCSLSRYPNWKFWKVRYAWAAGLGADALDELKLDGAMLAAMQGDVASPSGAGSDKSRSKRIRRHAVPAAGGRSPLRQVGAAAPSSELTVHASHGAKI